VFEEFFSAYDVKVAADLWVFACESVDFFLGEISS
jgi:hypothetical protein